MFAQRESGDAKSSTVVYGMPGLDEFVDIGDGPIRGMKLFDDEIFAVSGDRLFSVDSNGADTERGVIPLATRVSMSRNIAELVTVNGTDGYVWNGSTLTKIADADFQSAEIVDFLDQFLIFNKKGSGQFFISAFGDATDYDALDIATAEKSPDNLVSLIVDHDDLLLLSVDSLEGWGNTGGSFPYTKQFSSETGCAAKFSPAKIKNVVFWLGDDRRVYALEGVTPVPISHKALEGLIAKYSVVNDAFGYTMTYLGNPFYILSFPAEGKTWAFNVETKLWSEWTYFSGGAHTRHRSNCYVKAFDKHFVGDYQNGKIYELKHDKYTDNGDTIQRLMVSAPIHAEGREFECGDVEIIFEGGVGLSGGADPQAMLRWSWDGSNTWGNEIWRSIGKEGNYKNRAVWGPIGAGRQLSFELTISDAIKPVVISAKADITVLEN